MAQDRIYINQCSLREKVFDNGGAGTFLFFEDGWG